jgi:hypothetical protein
MLNSCIHSRSLAKSSLLTSQQERKFIPPAKLFPVLHENRIRFLLLGPHAIGGWLKDPRAAIPVEFLVPAGAYRRAADSLSGAFPRLKRAERRCRTEFHAPKRTCVIHLNRPDPFQPLLSLAFRHAVLVHTDGLPYRIPSLELAIALSFSAMRGLEPDWVKGPHALADRYLAAADFIQMIQSNPALAMEKLGELGRALGRSHKRTLMRLARKVQANEKGLDLLGRVLPSLSRVAPR